MEAGESLQTPATHEARRQQQLDAMDNGGVSPPWGTGGTLGRAAALQDMGGRDQDQPASSDGARGANLVGESMGIYLGRSTTHRTVNHGLAMPVAIMG